MFPHDPFPIIQIFVPLVAFAVVILCCVSLCKTLQRVRREHLESQVQARPDSPIDRPSVYIIPFSPAEEELRRPPRYSTVDYSSPPSYHELEIKSDFIPRDPPPMYTESISFQPTDLPPAQLSGSSPAWPPEHLESV